MLKGDTMRYASSSVDLSDNGKYKPFDIDFVGTGTFQLSQFDLLQKRSVELKKSNEAKLSARGLHHRSRNHFTREVHDSSAVIQQTLRQGSRINKNDTKALPYLLSSYFQRAVSYERLGQVNRAIKDLTLCIDIDPNCAPAFFNRAGLLCSQGKFDAATADLDMAIKLDPSNTTYLNNRALVLRRRGLYIDAIKDTMTCRAIHIDPSIIKELNSGHVVELDSNALTNCITMDDPVIVALRVPREERENIRLDAVIDFLRSLPCFAMITTDTLNLRRVALALDMRNYEKGNIVADDGTLSSHLFIVLEGELNVVRGLTEEDFFNLPVDQAPVLTSLSTYGWGETFSLLDIPPKNLFEYQNAGAVAAEDSIILTISSSEYNSIISQYNSTLQSEVREVLDHCAVFSNWSTNSLDRLAAAVHLKSFGANYEIIKAGDTVRYLYIIRRGVVKLVKAIDRPQTSNIQVSEFARPDSTVGMEPPGLWVLEKNWKDSIDTFDQHKGTGKVEFTVGVLGSGQVFGELSVLDPEQKSPFSVITFTNVELYCFSSEQLIALGSRFNSVTINALDESMNLHNPPGEKIAYYFRSKFAWEKKKDKLLEKIGRERQKLILKNIPNNSQKLPKITKSRLLF